MDLPIRAFWFMNSQIARILAEKDMRELTIANAATGAEASQQTRDHLIAELGMVLHEAPIRDQEGVNRLKELSKRMM